MSPLFAVGGDIVKEIQLIDIPSNLYWFVANYKIWFFPAVCSTEKDSDSMLEGSYDYSQLTNCTIIEGPLTITDRASIFQGPWNSSREEELGRFFGYFAAIEEITISMAITDTPLRNLSFLSRVKKIGSRMKDK